MIAGNLQDEMWFNEINYVNDKVLLHFLQNGAVTTETNLHRLGRRTSARAYLQCTLVYYTRTLWRPSD